MGRQHTTWISDETWKELQNIGGDSISKKIRNAVAMANPEREMVVKAKMRQLERARQALRTIHHLIHLNDDTRLSDIVDELEDVWWLVNE
jgi:23S rRNA C2498 (ribose-2'-O)-methylase RlmM